MRITIPAVRFADTPVAALVFLDVDGVLHTAFGGDKEFKVSCMKALCHLVHETQAALVLSSTWRLEPEGRASVEAALSAYGLPPLIGMTGSEARSRRHVEILDALALFPEASRWVVLDDQTIRLGRFVQTDGRTGMKKADAERAIHVLTGSALNH